MFLFAHKHPNHSISTKITSIIVTDPEGEKSTEESADKEKKMIEDEEAQLKTKRKEERKQEKLGLLDEDTYIEDEQVPQQAWHERILRGMVTGVGFLSDAYDLYVLSFRLTLSTLPHLPGHISFACVMEVGRGSVGVEIVE